MYIHKMIILLFFNMIFNHKKKNEDILDHLCRHRSGSSHCSQNVSIQRKLQRTFETRRTTAVAIRKEGNEPKHEQSILWEASRGQIDVG